MTTLVLILILSVSLPAQITIPTNNFNPPAGTVLRSSDAEITEDFYNTVTSGSGGGHLWDFSSILYSEEDSIYVVDCSSSPGDTAFPSANLCWMGAYEGDSTWIHSTSLPSSFQTLGIFARVQGSGDFAQVYYDLAPDYVFPIAMGNTWTAHHHWTQDVAPTIVTAVADSIFYEVQAYGQLKYGSKTVDCLRIKAIERVTTRTIVNGIPFSTVAVEFERYDYVTADYLDALSVIKTVTDFGTSYNSAANLNSLEQFTPVVEYDESALPTGFNLGQNYPNPFNPSTTISYALPCSAEVTLDIINIAGQKVKSFDFGHQDAGSYSVEIDLVGDLSTQLSSGVYFYKLSAGDFTQTRKMMLLK